MVRVTGKLEAAQAARAHARMEAMEDGSGDASAGRNSVEDDEAAGKVFTHPRRMKASLFSLIAI